MTIGRQVLDAEDDIPEIYQASSDDWKAAHDAWERYEGLICMNLALRSLPAGFASESGAAVLDPLAFASSAEPLPHAPQIQERAMIGDAFWRCIRTFEFLDEMFKTEGSPREDDVKLQKLVDVRNQHIDIGGRLRDSQIADRLKEMHPDRAPMDGFQMVGSACSFVVPVAVGFEEMRLDVRGEVDWDAWTRVWFEITAWQSEEAGDWLNNHHHPQPSCLEDAKCIETLIYNEEPPKRTLGGVRLMRNLFADIYDALPRPVRPLLRIGFTYAGIESVNRRLLLRESRLGALMRPHRHRGRLLGHVTWRVCDWSIRRLIKSYRPPRSEPLKIGERFPRNASAAPIEISEKTWRRRTFEWAWQPPESTNDYEPESTSI